jgi:hypothetical protein
MMRGGGVQLHYVTNRGVPQYPGYNSEKIKLYKNDNETFMALEANKSEFLD